MEIGILPRFCKSVANIFLNGTPVLRTIVLTALNNPLLYLLVNYMRIKISINIPIFIIASFNVHKEIIFQNNNIT